MDLLERLNPRALIAASLLAGLSFQLLLGTAYIGAFLDPLHEGDGVPVLLVNRDEGPHGRAFVKRLHSAASPIQWVDTQTLDALAAKQAYGAIVIPQNFSAALDSFGTSAPYAALVETYSNPGASTSANAIARSAIATALDVASREVQLRAIASVPEPAPGLGAVTLSQARFLAEPIRVEAFEVNALPAKSALGLAPTYLAMASWIGGYIGAVALERFRVKTKLPTTQRSLLIVGAAIAQGAIATGVLSVVGLSMTQAFQVALLITLGTWMAYALVSLLMDLLGLAGLVPAFAILAIGLPASGAVYPVDVLPGFFQAVHPIDPFTWLVEGLRTTLYAPGATDLVASQIKLAAVALGATAISLAWARFVVSRRPA